MGQRGGFRGSFNLNEGFCDAGKTELMKPRVGRVSTTDLLMIVARAADVGWRIGAPMVVVLSADHPIA